MTLYREVGGLVLGTRLKRLSNRFLADVSQIYKSLDIVFEPSWFPIFYLLDRNRRMSIGEIAQEMEVTHSGASQMINTLIKKKLVQFLTDENDKRIRQITLTKCGETLLSQIKPVWDALSHCVDNIMDEGDNSPFLLLALDEMENALAGQQLVARVTEEVKKRNAGELEFNPLRVGHIQAFRNLLLSWILDNEGFDLDDMDLINDPMRFISQKRGRIDLVEMGEEIVGAAVTQFSGKKAEILVFAIDASWQNRRIGRTFMAYLIQQFKADHRESVSIQITRRQVRAMRILRRSGFELAQADGLHLRMINNLLK